MTSAERFRYIFSFKPVDRIFNCEFGWWRETFTSWHSQGLPSSITTNQEADQYFGFDQRYIVPINSSLIPAFEEKVIAEEKNHTILFTDQGATVQIFTDGSSAIPHYLSFPVETRQDWIEYRKRLSPDSPRYPENWDSLKKEISKMDIPIGVSCGSLFGEIRNRMGFERALVTFYDDPIWMEEMMEYATCFTLSLLEKALTELPRIDFALFWEDMAFKTQPMISPELFRKFMIPRYQRIVDRLKKAGIDFFIVDCDGNINELVPLWLESGVNIMFPLEINSSSDPVSLRKEYGKDLLLLGGVDKIALIKGKSEIDRELERIRPIVEEGGYIPHVDHRVPPDVSFEHYLYYLHRKKEIFRITDWEIPHG
ncbi:MAG: uroporphyrinogen decarboxylase family protein [Candidatus Ratteibacteria bacterium]